MTQTKQKSLSPRSSLGQEDDMKKEAQPSLSRRKVKILAEKKRKRILPISKQRRLKLMGLMK